MTSPCPYCAPDERCALCIQQDRREEMGLTRVQACFTVRDMAGTGITQEQRAAALQACREAGIGTSDCQLVRPDGEDYLELRSASGAKRLAIIPMTLDGRVVEAWRS